MYRFFVSLLVTFLLSSYTVAAENYPQSAFIYDVDTDYTGGDLRQIFETTNEYCQKACLKEKGCVAYTYNTKSSACFLKTGDISAEAYEGALSAKLISFGTTRQEIGNLRLKELSFLNERELKSALQLRRDVAWASGDILINHGKLGGYEVDNIAQFLQDAAFGNSNNWMSMYDQFDNIKNLPSNMYSLRNKRMGQYINAYLDAETESKTYALRNIIRKLKDEPSRGIEIINATKFLYKLTGSDQESIAQAIEKYGPRVLDYDVEVAASKPRVCFSYSEPLLEEGVDYSDYIQSNIQDLVTEAKDKRLCLSGMQFSDHVEIRIREGMPTRSGIKSANSNKYDLYIPQREASVRFQGQGYVLPKGDTATVPIVTVNSDEVEVSIYRSSERILTPLLLEELFLKPLSDRDKYKMANQFGNKIWEGIAETNGPEDKNVITALPVQEIINQFEPGLYAMTANISGQEAGSYATQWFLISDIGLTTYSGSDGLHLLTKSLQSAKMLPGMAATLLSKNNQILAEVTTDEQGYAHFPMPVLAGKASNAPALLTVKTDGDLAILDLRARAFDFSARGVEGRSASSEFDIFATTDRGIYQPGDDIHTTVLLRNSTAEAIIDIPLTAISYRPDGQEYSKQVLLDEGSGGRVYSQSIEPTAQRGRWTTRFYTDPKEPSLAEVSFLIEDFVPERIDFVPEMKDGAIEPDSAPKLLVTANYLYGAKGMDLPLTGVIERRAITTLPKFPGFSFGSPLAEERANVTELPDGLTTDANGNLSIGLPLPPITSKYQPEQLKISLQMSEGSGRPVERSLTRYMEPSSPLIGIKPLFEDAVPEGAEANFEVIVVGQGMASINVSDLKWRMEAIDTDYQWFKVGRRWDYMPIETKKLIKEGALVTANGNPATLSVPLDWGNYLLTISSGDGTDLIQGSYEFYAGYYGGNGKSDTPDRLNTGIDKDNYAENDNLELRINAPSDGVAQIVVLNGSFIEQRSVSLNKGENGIDFNIDEKWGAGAYILTSFIQPMDHKKGRNPTRAVGVNWVSIDASSKTLDVKLTVPEMVNPNQKTVIGIDAIAKKSGKIYATISAVDLGILNLTGFKSPNPEAYYFGQRKLGFEVRDIYGRLIDGFAGSDGILRSGGDDVVARKKGAGPKTETYLTLFSGLVTLDRNGHADIPLDIPEFNGAMKVMAVAWSDVEIGHADQEVLVRNPIVVMANNPRFMSPNDRTTLRLDIAHAYGATGLTKLRISSKDTNGFKPVNTEFELAEGERKYLDVPLMANVLGVSDYVVEITTPDNISYTKTVSIDVTKNDLPITKLSQFDLAANTTSKLSVSLFDGFSDTAKVTLIPAFQYKLDIAGLIHALETYPYGCSEQLVSSAQPLLSFADRTDKPKLAAERLQQTVQKLLANQATNGFFGLWGPEGSDLWLHAYVMDFMVRAKEAGAKVPDRAFEMGLLRLKNIVSNETSFEDAGEDVAYALKVLADAGQASIGDLRYFSDTKGDDFHGALARAQLASALNAYGEKERSNAMFKRAFNVLNESWDYDAAWTYGSSARDKAATLTLAVDSGFITPEKAIAEADFGRISRQGSTQEQAWALRLADALKGSKEAKGLFSGLKSFSYQEVLSGKVALKNTSTVSVPMYVSVSGMPSDEVTAQANGYKITRRIFTMAGDRVDSNNIKQNDKMVVVIEVTPELEHDGHLMVDDPLPAGLEIDNPNLLESGDINSLPWLSDLDDALHSEFHKDRFISAIDWEYGRSFKLAYIVRAISVGEFHYPAAHVSDMYQTEYNGHTQSGTITIVAE